MNEGPVPLFGVLSRPKSLWLCTGSNNCLSWPSQIYEFPIYFQYAASYAGRLMARLQDWFVSVLRARLNKFIPPQKEATKGNAGWPNQINHLFLYPCRLRARTHYFVLYVVPPTGQTYLFGSVQPNKEHRVCFGRVKEVFLFLHRHVFSFCYLLVSSTGPDKAKQVL